VVAALDVLDGDGWLVAEILEAHPAMSAIAVIENNRKYNREAAKSAKKDAQNEIFSSGLRVFASNIEFPV
jgi:hypothetical protein